MTRAWLAALACVAGCQGCVNGQPSPAVVPSVNLAVCVLDGYATSPSCRSTGNWVACVSNIAAACGADAASVEQVLAAQKKAAIADGVVYPPDGGGK